MKTSTECPACRKLLRLWHGFRAGTPFRMRCPHCRTRLRIRLRGLVPVFWLVVTAGVVIGGIVGVFFASGRAGTAGIIVAALLMLWVLAELVTGIILYTYAEFSVYSPRATL